MAGLIAWDNYLNPPSFRVDAAGLRPPPFFNGFVSGLFIQGSLSTDMHNETTSKGAWVTPVFNGTEYEVSFNLFFYGWETAGMPDTFILGAHQHIVGAFADVASIYVTYSDGLGSGVAGFLDLTILSKKPWHKQPSVYVPMNVSISSVNSHSTYIQLRSPSASDIFIPDLFVGRAIQTPAPDWGFDPRHEVWAGSKFKTISGRIVEQTHLKQMHLQPRFSHFPESLADEFDSFREGIIEERRPFWYIPDTTKPYECWHVKSSGSISFPKKTPVSRSLSLDLLEAV